MMTKNEEAFMAQALTSVRGLVAEIIVIDTGSEDKTISIAERCGAHVYSYPWENNFSLHRNQSITHAAGDWILIMDADEVIALPDHPRILSLLDSESVDGFLFTLRNYENSLDLANITINRHDYREGANYPGFIAQDLIRLFRRDPQIYFTGRVHESVTESFMKSNKKTINTGLPIHHYGKVRADRGNLKQEFYLELGRKRLRDNDSDPIAFLGLAEQCLELGKNTAAREILEKGLSLFPDHIELHFNRGLALDRLGMPQEAKKEYFLVIRSRPQHLGAAHNLAQIFFKEKYFEKCTDILERAIVEGVRSPAIFLLLGRAYGELTDYEKALFNMEIALKINSGYPNAHYFRAVVLLKIQRFAEAVEALGNEISINGNLCAANNLLGEISLMWNDYKSAANFFHQVIVLDPLNRTAGNYLAQIPAMQLSVRK
jgi:tetratricopeptide (TPR) repeat protein